MDNLLIPELSAYTPLLIKVFAIIGLSMYAIFSGVIVRQEQLMDKVIDETFEPILKLLILLHFAGSLALIVLALVIL